MSNPLMRAILNHLSRTYEELIQHSINLAGAQGYEQQLALKLKLAEQLKAYERTIRSSNPGTWIEFGFLRRNHVGNPEGK